MNVQDIGTSLNITTFLEQILRQVHAQGTYAESEELVAVGLLSCPDSIALLAFTKSLDLLDVLMCALNNTWIIDDRTDDMANYVQVERIDGNIHFTEVASLPIMPAIFTEETFSKDDGYDDVEEDEDD